MDEAKLRELLDQVVARKLTVDAALQQLQAANSEADLGFAHVDLERQRRCGFPEVIFCEGKTNEWVEAVVNRLIEAGQDCLATRLCSDQAKYLEQRFPQAQLDSVARTFWLPANQTKAPNRSCRRHHGRHQRSAGSARSSCHRRGGWLRDHTAGGCRCGRHSSSLAAPRSIQGRRCDRRGRGNGRSAPQRCRRPGRLPCDRCADKRWLRRRIRRRGTTANDAQ